MELLSNEIKNQIWGNDLSALKEKVKKDVTILTKQDDRANSGLLFAVKNKNVEVIRLIYNKSVKQGKIEELKNSLIVFDESGRNVLHNAAFIPENGLVIAELILIARQLEIENYVDAKDMLYEENMQKTALHLACHQAQTENALTLLRHGANLFLKTDNKFPLELCPCDDKGKKCILSLFQLSEIVRYYYEDRYGNFAPENAEKIIEFDQLVKLKNTSEAQYLAYTALNELFHQKLIGLNTYISSIFEINFTKIMEFIEKNNIKEQIWANTLAGLLFSVKNKKVDVIRLIYNEGIKQGNIEELKNSLIVVDKSGKNILHHAAVIPENGVVIAELLFIAKQLEIENYVDAKNMLCNENTQQTALHLACQEARTENALTLLHHGANLFLKTDNKFPLELCPCDDKGKKFIINLFQSSEKVRYYYEGRYGNFLAENAEKIIEFDQLVKLKNTSESQYLAYTSLNNLFHQKLIELNTYAFGICEINFTKMMEFVEKNKIVSHEDDHFKKLKKILKHYPIQDKVINLIMAIHLLKKQNIIDAEKIAFRYCIILVKYRPDIAYKKMMRLNTKNLFQTPEKNSTIDESTQFLYAYEVALGLTSNLLTSVKSEKMKKFSFFTKSNDIEYFNEKLKQTGDINDIFNALHLLPKYHKLRLTIEDHFSANNIRPNLSPRLHLK